MILAFSHLVIIFVMIIYENSHRADSQSANPLNTVAISSVRYFVRNMGVYVSLFEEISKYRGNIKYREI